MLCCCNCWVIVSIMLVVVMLVGNLFDNLNLIILGSNIVIGCFNIVVLVLMLFIFYFNIFNLLIMVVWELVLINVFG